MSVRAPVGARSDRGTFEIHSSVARRRGRLALRREALLGQIGLAGLPLCCLALTVAAPHTEAMLPESVRPIPTWLAGPFGSSRLGGLSAGPLLLLLAAMFGAYVLAARYASRQSTRVVLMAIAALNALVLLAPPLLSTDVFSYQAYARIGAVYGANPYLVGPHGIALDQIYPFIGSKWVSMPTAYGPLFTLLSYPLAGLSIAASALAFKAIAALSSLILVALVWHAARLRGLDPLRAVALVGLNPLIVLYGVGGGHNDLLMIAIVLAGIYLMLAHREGGAGVALVLSIGIKVTGGLFGLFAFAEHGGSKTPRQRRRLLVAAAATAVILAAVSLAVFGSGVFTMLATIGQGQSEGDWHSLSGFVSTTLGLPLLGHIVGGVLAAAFVALLVWLLRRVWRGELDWIDGAAWATVALLVSASALFPWYVAWLIPLAALASDRRLWRVAIILTGLVQAIEMVGYLPH